MHPSQLTTLPGVLKIKHIKCSGVPTRHPAPLRVHLMDKLKIRPQCVVLTADALFFRGRTPAEAELMYLENAKKLDMYGVHLQEAKVNKVS